MKIPESAFSSDLTDYQFRLLSYLCLKSDLEGRLKVSVIELGRSTGKDSDRTVRTALQALERGGWISRTKSRRANGFQGIDTYQITQNYRTTEVVSTSDYRTSHSNVTNSSDSNTVDIQLVPSSHNTNSNQIKDLKPRLHKRKVVVSVKRYTDDGDDLAGFGLVEPRDKPQAKISKADPRTRGKRPEHEWTSMDVAAEFSFKVGRKYPLLPGTVNVRQLSGALAKFRSQYQTTPLIELELLRLFMADDRNFRDVGDEAPFLYKRYLASFRTHMNQARQNLGLKRLESVEFDETPRSASVGTLTASDGRTFKNTLTGRTQLERHENRLKEASNG